MDGQKSFRRVEIVVAGCENGGKSLRVVLRVTSGEYLQGWRRVGVRGFFSGRIGSGGVGVRYWGLDGV